MHLYNRDFILANLSIVQEQRRMIMSLMVEIDQRLEDIENLILETDIEPVHYDTLCNCDDCNCRRNTYKAMFADDVDIMDDVSYRMD